MPNAENDHPLTWAIGEQKAAAKAAGLTLETWQEQQKGAPEPDLYFQTAGPDAPEADE